jgi:drug/metabolite transporter (DMT)-like permease
MISGKVALQRHFPRDHRRLAGGGRASGCRLALPVGVAAAYGSPVSKRAWILFGSLCVLWGIPYLLIKIAVEDLSPATIVLARTFLAALLLVPLAVGRGQLAPALARWPMILVFAVIEMVLTWPLLGYAEIHVSSSLAGLLIAAVPLVGAVLVRFGRERERLDPRRALGLFVGLGGVAALVGFDVAGGDLLAILALAGVVLGYALGPVILSRYLSDLPGLGVIALALALSTVLSAPFGIAQAPSQWPSIKVMLAVIALALLCTAAAFLVFFALIGEIGPVRASVVTYVNPAVALLLGVVVLDERVTAATAVGFALILAGSVLATGSGRRVLPTTEPAPASL